ncbi:DUF2201 family putative metallopeptidase [Vreelandella rituensis]|nr:hypothetical protein [Halomonas rituensis]
MFTAQCQVLDMKPVLSDIPCIKNEQLTLWQADRDAWRRDHPLMAMLADGLALVPVLDDRLATATTDGQSLFFNAAYSAGLNATTRAFLQAHLVWHCVAGHLHEKPHLDGHRWHLACDHEVNALLMLQGFPVCEDTVLFPSRMKQSANDVYDWLSGHPALEREVSLDQLPCLPLASSSLPNAWQRATDPDYRPQPLNEQVESGWQHQAIQAAHHCQTPLDSSGSLPGFLIT